MPARTISPRKRTSRRPQIKDPVVKYRVYKFLDLGFSFAESRMLEKCFEGKFIGDSYHQTRLSHHTVRKHMERGATKEQIVSIYG